MHLFLPLHLLVLYFELLLTLIGIILSIMHLIRSNIKVQLSINFLMLDSGRGLCKLWINFDLDIVVHNDLICVDFVVTRAKSTL